MENARHDPNSEHAAAQSPGPGVEEVRVLAGHGAVAVGAGLAFLREGAEAVEKMTHGRPLLCSESFADTVTWRAQQGIGPLRRE